jgi:hypothetical protein
MSIGSISLQTPRFIEQNAEIDPRLQVNAGDSSCWTTALKVAAVIAGLAASIGSFAFLGPIAGIVTTVVCGAGLLLLFTDCCRSSHNHQHNNAIVPVLPWYQRVFTYIPFGTNYMHHGHHEQVGNRNGNVGGSHQQVGHRDPNVGPGHQQVGHRDPNVGPGHQQVGRRDPNVGPGHQQVGQRDPNNLPIPLHPPLQPSGPGGHERVGGRGH